MFYYWNYDLTKDNKKVTSIGVCGVLNFFKEYVMEIHRNIKLLSEFMYRNISVFGIYGCGKVSNQFIEMKIYITQNYLKIQFT
uniref:Uncharacterized protein n=1 Tax=Strongyloides papillosus TaxID=174720 RepID=A0A0N5BQS2_STREA